MLSIFKNWIGKIWKNCRNDFFFFLFLVHYIFRWEFALNVFDLMEKNGKLINVDERKLWNWGKFWIIVSIQIFTSFYKFSWKTLAIHSLALKLQLHIKQMFCRTTTLPKCLIYLPTETSARNALQTPIIPHEGFHFLEQL